ncbi:rhomboid family intramembrane serine protease [bacterium]|nr:rhomboid family intramembrane serine protease [bacterium]
MNDLQPQPDINDPATRDCENWVRVGHYPSLAEAYDHGLVVLAMGEACRVAETAEPGEYELQAEPIAASRVSAELEIYGREIALPVRKFAVENDWTRHSPGWIFCGIWVLVLIAVFIRQGEDPRLVDRAASSSLGLIGRGEWWRPFTGLFLHGDVGHLLGNLVSGTIFAALVARMVGPLLGWTLILACGALGNTLTSVLTYPQPFVSIGASTAVFAALGILSGVGIAETLRERTRLPWLRILAPVLAGIILLGWLGGGHQANTDVLGHVFGFSSGLAAGTLVGALETKRPVD